MKKQRSSHNASADVKDILLRLETEKYNLLAISDVDIVRMPTNTKHLLFGLALLALGLVLALPPLLSSWGGALSLLAWLLVVAALCLAAFGGLTAFRARHEYVLLVITERETLIVLDSHSRKYLYQVAETLRGIVKHHRARDGMPIAERPEWI